MQFFPFFTFDGNISDMQWDLSEPNPGYNEILYNPNFKIAVSLHEFVSKHNIE